MKCKIIDCTDEAQAGFECCNSLHGLMLKTARNVLWGNQYFGGIGLVKSRKEALSQWRVYFYGDSPTIEEALLYGIKN